MAIEVYNDAVTVLTPVLKTLVSSRYNSKYGIPALVRCAAVMCSENTYAETVLSNLRELKAEGIPVPHWFRDRIRNVPEEETLQICHGMIDATVQRLKGMGLLARPHVIAIDLHLIPNYEKNPDMRHLVGAGKLPGTTRAQAFITAQIVGNGPPITVGLYPVAKGEPYDYFVENIIDDMRANGVKAKMVLLDRGFYSAGVINALEDKVISFLMPAVKGSRMLKELAHYDKGGDQVAEFEIRSKKYGRAKFLRVIYETEDSKEREEIKDRYYVFATNIPYEKVNQRIKTLSQEYKERWSIETTYREIESVRARTRSKSFSLKLFLYYFSTVFANMWVMLNYTIPDARKNGRATMRGMTLYKFARTLYLYVLLRALKSKGIIRLLKRWPG